jgi:general secretion pathway protein I
MNSRPLQQAMYPLPVEDQTLGALAHSEQSTILPMCNGGVLPSASTAYEKPAMRLPRPASMHGFTLLEVLVAFLVLSLSVSVLLRIVSQSLAALDSAEHYQSALQLAESRLALVLVELNRDSQGKQEGRVDSDYRWQSEIKPYHFDNQEAGAHYPINPWLIRVSVSWGHRPAQRVSLSTVRLLQEAQ